MLEKSGNSNPMLTLYRKKNNGIKSCKGEIEKKKLTRLHNN